MTFTVHGWQIVLGLFLLLSGGLLLQIGDDDEGRGCAFLVLIPLGLLMVFCYAMGRFL